MELDEEPLVVDAIPNTSEFLRQNFGERLKDVKNSSKPEAELSKFIEELLKFLTSDEHCEKRHLVAALKPILGHSDLFVSISSGLSKKLKTTKDVTETAKWKIFWLLTGVQKYSERKKMVDFLSKKGNLDKKQSDPIALFRRSLQNVWIAFFGILQEDQKLLRTIVPYFVESVMDRVPEPELFSDFLYRTFHRGHYLAVVSLGGIFKLIVKRNFDHPSFYTDVYGLISSNVCYSSYAAKFFDLVDLILSSTHVPVYVITAFVKRLSRVLLLAPVDSQLPLLRLIKNLLCRHASVHAILLDREEPATLDTDPYDSDETDLQKCRAGESSLWELKAIQGHWHYKVAGKAGFASNCSQDREVPLCWRSNDALFEELMRCSGKRLMPEEMGHQEENELAGNEGLSEEEDAAEDELLAEETRQIDEALALEEADEFEVGNSNKHRLSKEKSGEVLAEKYGLKKLPKYPSEGQEEDFSATGDKIPFKCGDFWTF